MDGMQGELSVESFESLQHTRAQPGGLRRHEDDDSPYQVLVMTRLHRDHPPPSRNFARADMIPSLISSVG